MNIQRSTIYTFFCRILLCTTLILSALILPLTSYAEGNLTQKSAAALAKKQYGGKVVNVSSSEENGRKVYKVKLLLDGGRVKMVTIR